MWRAVRVKDLCHYKVTVVACGIRVDEAHAHVAPGVTLAPDDHGTIFDPNRQTRGDRFGCVFRNLFCWFFRFLTAQGGHVQRGRRTSENAECCGRIGGDLQLGTGQVTFLAKERTNDEFAIGDFIPVVGLQATVPTFGPHEFRFRLTPGLTRADAIITLQSNFVF